MKRLGVDDYIYKYDPEGWGWIEFVYKKEKYKFEHSVGKARAKNIDLQNGEDAFIQLVLAIEDLARLAERGIYDLQSWIEGLKMLPVPK